MTFKKMEGKARLAVHRLDPSMPAHQDAIASDSTRAWTQPFDQLYALLNSLGARV